jgi:hypothetical protein
MISLADFQLNWNQQEDLIERTVLKRFLMAYIHVNVKVSFRCIKFKIGFDRQFFCTKFNISSQLWTKRIF